VVFSAYYGHTLAASLKPSPRFRWPLYRRPPDLAERDVPGTTQKDVGRREDGSWKPYFTRREIDVEGILSGEDLELAWADDPLDVFFLQVQGSGWLRLPPEEGGGRLRVRYAGNNGHPYRSVGGYMIETGLVTKATFSRETMRAYFDSHPGERLGLLAQNPRYVFFEIDRSSSAEEIRGSLKVPLTAGRSVATDPDVFPPGALAWIDVPGDPPVRRFVLNQDQGGAIKGAGRVDYFAGDDEAAEAFAVKFWRTGGLYFLLLKD
jgi:membrane-bound lytic murein transglycosylase A